MSLSRRLFGTLLFSLLAGSALAAAPQYPFQNTALPAEQRVENLLSLLTLQEKIDLLGKNLNLPRLGVYGSAKIDSIPGSSGQFEGLHGLAVGGPNFWNRKSPAPDGGTAVIPTTQFPQPAGMGATWDPALLEQAAGEEAYEARYVFQSFGRGGLIVRAPNADLARDPRWGRSEESFGEDPYLVGTLSVAIVKGLQGDDPKYWMAASLVKHFLANSNEDDRTGSSSNFDTQLLHEYYAVPFRMAIEQGHANALMTAYNAVNGIPMAASPLLRSLVMDGWGFNGMIDTDRGALTFMVTKHHYSPDIAHAAANAIHAGVNQFLNPYQDAVKDALAQKLITPDDLDTNVKGVLRVMLRLGFLNAAADDPYSSIHAGNVPVPWERASAKALALKVTQESIVLLKNTGDLLPLNAQKTRTLAVIGPRADQVYLDGYSGTPSFAVTPLAGIRERAGAGITVLTSAGGAEAVADAKRADAAVVVIGNLPFCRRKTDPAPCPAPSDGQEGIDRKVITLAPDQEQLVRDVYAANPHTIVVLVTSFPYAIDWAAEHIPAIVEMAGNSEEKGTALARALFGDDDPGGKLTVTWPRSLDQLPPMMDYNLRDGRTYMYFKGSPLFPFGYGLSYTRFGYAQMRMSAATVSAGATVQVSAQVKNQGSRDGSEVVQMYVQYPDAKAQRPRLQLVGFARVPLAAGETKTVTLPLHADALRTWDAARNEWVLPPGPVRVLVGGSSASLPLHATVLVR